MNIFQPLIQPVFSASVLPAETRLGNEEIYPNRPVHLIAPGPAGGPGDMTAQLIAPKLAECLGQPVIIDNQPSIDVGLKIAASAPADGYSIVIVGGSHYIKSCIYRNLRYDPVNDFVAISLVVSGFNILVTHPSVAVESVAELIALAKSKPGHLKYASGGHGSPSHLAGELFKIMAGVDIVHVPYNGHVPAGRALSEGREVQLMFDAMLTAIPHIKEGKWKALAVTTAKRASIMPSTPTIADSGLAGYEVSPAMGILAPAGTPEKIIIRLSKEIAKVLQMPEVRAHLQRDGGEPIGSTPEQFAAYVKSAFEKWGKLVKDAGIRTLDSPS